MALRMLPSVSQTLDNREVKKQTPTQVAFQRFLREDSYPTDADTGANHTGELKRPFSKQNVIQPKHKSLSQVKIYGC